MCSSDLLRERDEAEGQEFAEVLLPRLDQGQAGALADDTKEVLVHAAEAAVFRAVQQEEVVHRPRVLLLDEPASGLDPEVRASLAGLFRQFQAQGMTLVVSSHILSELDEYCTHILTLRAGRITQHESLLPDAAPPSAAASASASASAA